jgi:two-component system sensor histidine kinase BaeS
VRRPGLLGRSILASVLVASVASAVTALLTVDAVQAGAKRERVRVADVDQGIVARLEAHGRENHRWSDVGPVLDEVAVSSDRSIVITDVDGRPLARSSGARPGGVGVGDPTALLDPLAKILAEAGHTVPASYDQLVLPPALLDVLPRGRALRSGLPGSYDSVGACASDDLDMGQGGPSVTLLVDTECRPARASRLPTRPGSSLDAVRLQDAVALDMQSCLTRRDVPAVLTRLLARAGTGTPDVVTVHVPRRGRPAPSAPVVTRAWKDCTTSVLTRALGPHVAPRALLYVSETRRVDRSVLERVGGMRIVTALAAVLAVAVIASLAASRRVLRPVRTLTAATQEMATGRRAVRVEVAGDDEVARLARSFNDMADALADGDRQRRRMVSDVAHELRTPLSNLRGYLEAGHDGVLDRDDAWNALLLEEAMLLQHLVDDLTVLAQADAGRLALRLKPGDIVRAVDAVLLAMTPHAESREVVLRRTGEASIVVPHDPIRIRQVVMNLVSNAVRHSPLGGTVTVDVRTDRDETRSGDVVIEVQDDGEGIGPEHLRRVFERFYRADPSRTRDTGGSGLGLSIVQHLVEGHGGTVAAANRPDGGAVLTVRLPLVPPPGQSRSATAADTAERNASSS